LALADNKAVQKELALNEEKAAKVKDLLADYTEELQQQIQGAGIGGRGAGDLSAEERQKRMAQMTEITKNVNDKFMPKLNELLDKTQQTRLHEIWLQAAGPSALQDADVAKALAITKDQQDNIKKLTTDFGHKMREAFTAGGDRSEIQAKVAELREEQTAKTAEVLTKDQQAKFTEMKGKPFDVKQLNQGGGRRRRNNN
jgi:type II secretory pathway component PulK